MSDEIGEDERELQAERDWALQEERDEARRKAAAERPRVVIVCDGKDGHRGHPSKLHRPAVIAVYARDSDGTLLPIHSALRYGGNRELILPESGYRPTTGQFDFPACPNRRCGYIFRHPVSRVTGALERLLPAGGEVSLRKLEAELRDT